MKIDAPTGKVITSVSINTETSDVSTDPKDTYNASTGTWTGNTTSVSFTRPSDASSYVTIDKITVVLANKITLASACTYDSKYYGTYSSAKPFKVPSDLTVSEIKVVDGKLSLSNYSTGDVVPANTGVMIASSTAGDHTMTIATGGESKLGSENMLKATGDAGITAEDMNASSTKFYRLTMHNGTKIGFWWGAAEGAAFALGANKAYLAVPVATARSGFNLFGDDDTTDIETVDVNTESANVAREYYNLNGQRVANPSKGLYIVNGKKVIIK